MEPVSRIVLLGFMCSGKSAVGRHLARRLGWEHLDLDKHIEAGERRSVPEIFAVDGEQHFRALEALYTAGLAERRQMVLSPGGGWITNPDLLKSFGAGTLSVWLRVSAGTVMRRVRRARDVRPLLVGDDARAVAERLLGEREPLYRLADVTVNGNQASVAELSRLIEAIARRRGAVLTASTK